ncbi:MAG: hypothetical protein IH846_13120 [Acidobacteria bacterium]|nr:hypothetical protein [Acidobacteriota bacterium]
MSLEKYYPDGVLQPERRYGVEEIWDRAAKAASLEASGGEAMHDLEWFKKHGAFLAPFPQDRWYLHTVMEEKALRYELPYQERIMRMGRELANRLHEMGVDWWEAQLAEYSPLPGWKDFPGIWEAVASEMGKDPGDYGLWMLTTRSMQYAWGSTVALPIIAEVAANVTTHFGVVVNGGTARSLGIADGDEIAVGRFSADAENAAHRPVASQSPYQRPRVHALDRRNPGLRQPPGEIGDRPMVGVHP